MRTVSPFYIVWLLLLAGRREARVKLVKAVLWSEQAASLTPRGLYLWLPTRRPSSRLHDRAPVGYCSGSWATDNTMPTLSLVRGLGPRPSAKARSSVRRARSSPGKP